MRISPQEHNIIVSHVRSVFGENAEVFLFGFLVDDETVEAMDQLIFRFIKLQDAMGLRVFPRLPEYLNEPMENS
ncbi:MAG: hypothetical protein EH225_04925 [Calditrichaeota bacterium]|nr:MAG: hypothetical protein EH225_04925 [Calditrichota bacterium]